MTGRRGWASLRTMFGRKRKPADDFFQRAVAERRASEDEQPWFLAPDDGPELEVDAGRSARMDDEAGSGE